MIPFTSRPQTERVSPQWSPAFSAPATLSFLIALAMLFPQTVPFITLPCLAGNDRSFATPAHDEAQAEQPVAESKAFLDRAALFSGKVGWFDLEAIFLMSPAVRSINPATGSIENATIREERKHIAERINALGAQLRALREELSMGRRIALTRWSMEKVPQAREIIMKELQGLEDAHLKSMEPLKKELLRQKQIASSIGGDSNLADFLGRTVDSLSATIDTYLQTSKTELAFDSSRFRNFQAAADKASKVRVPYQNEGLWLLTLTPDRPELLTEAITAQLRYSGNIYLNTSKLANIPQLSGPIHPVDLTDPILLAVNGKTGQSKSPERKND